jgi:HAD superfamily hydrolase (TIGR01509 family)
MEFMIRTIIFDFDGIITDTEPVHMKAWLEVLNSLYISFDEDEYYSCYVGLNDRDFLDAVGDNHDHEFTDREKGVLIERKAIASHRILEERIPLIPGVDEIVPQLAKKYPLAICSGAQKSEINFILTQLGWLDHFRPIVTQEDVAKGKPDPEGFLFTLKHFQQHQEWDPPLEASQCLVIEDSPHGIEAAKAAGMPVVAITNSFSSEDLHDADRVVDSLGEALGGLLAK